ncbi:ABC transporter ATP-binding protein/permease [Sphingomonas sp. PB1R3]|uniref:ABC transporter ATP-binding protein/permease n=1 Tax=Sphingomonas flavida TaxID=3096154 RepID=UPI002FC9C14A
MLPQPVPSGESRRETGLALPQPAGERWRHAFDLLRDYWTSKDWKFAWGALIVLMAFQFAGAWLFVIMNRWQQRFFDGVENRDVAGFASLLTAFIGILALQMVFVILEPYIRRMLCLRWRIHLTETYLDRWLSRNRYAEIERLRMIDNPDQRIADDIKFVADPEVGTLSILTSLVYSIVSAISSIMILLETSGPIRFALFGWRVSIPGGTVVYAALYVLVSSVVMVLLGKPYIRAMMGWQHREADFRSNLIHVRRNAPQIGLADAVATERLSLRSAVQNVYLTSRSVIRSLIGLNAANGLYDRLGSIIPLFILVPRYFAGAITFGQVMGGRDAFQQLVPQLGFFVHLYPRIATQISYINRLKALDDAIDHERPMGITANVGTSEGIAVATAGLLIRRPHGEPLVEVGDWQVRTGERWVIRGPSGAGKSTLLRALAGLWPDGVGQVALADRSAAMFVPQRLYLPLGTLKAAICFPDAPEDHDDAAIAALLDMVHLSHLADDLHGLRMWSEELSPGEQQRVALMRILLQKPDLLILDEATSALDPANTQHFHDLLGQHLGDVTIISVVHDERLHRYHDHALVIADGRATAGRLELQA